MKMCFIWMLAMATWVVSVVATAQGPSIPASPTATTAKPPAEVQASVGALAAASKSETTNALDVLANEAMAMLTRGQSKEAVALFKQVLREDKNHRRALFGLGTCYVELRQYREAKVVLERMREIYPDAFEALNNLAWMYATSSDPAYRDGRKAIEYAQQAVLLAPNVVEIWNTLSEAYFVAGDYEKGLRAATEAVRLSKDINAPPNVVQSYEQQMEKCRRAVEAMSLVE